LVGSITALVSDLQKGVFQPGLKEFFQPGLLRISALVWHANFDHQQYLPKKIQIYFDPQVHSTT
jgi:hypothetical protein